MKVDTIRMMTVYSLGLVVMALLILILFKDRKRLRKTTEEDESVENKLKVPLDNLTQSNGSRTESSNYRATGLARENAAQKNLHRSRVSFRDQLIAIWKDSSVLCYVIGIFFVSGCILGFMSNFVGMVSSFGISEVSFPSKNLRTHQNQ